MKKDNIYLSWCNRFSCPGGDCGLNCCLYDWNIFVTDKEIERFKQIKPPFRDEVLNAIDLEKKKMKCSKGQCDLLDENMYCKLVINEGPEALSYTCATFPWNVNDFGFLCENTVEIACPLVAEYLFDKEPIDFEVRTISAEKITKDQNEIRDYLNLFALRSRLVEIIQSNSGEYIYGKTFILNKLYCDVIKVMNEGRLNEDCIQEILSSYSDESVTASIFSQCESLANGLSLREGMIYDEFVNLIREEFVVVILSNSIYKDERIQDTFNTWLNNKEAFIKDLHAYVEHMNSNYPTFLENYFVYSLFRNWHSSSKGKFNEGIAMRFIELFFIQLCGMSVMREFGFVDVKKLGVLIANLDRLFAHGDKGQYLGKYYEEKMERDSLSIVMTLIA